MLVTQAPSFSEVIKLLNQYLKIAVYILIWKKMFFFFILTYILKLNACYIGNCGEGAELFPGQSK